MVGVVVISSVRTRQAPHDQARCRESKAVQRSLHGPMEENSSSNSTIRCLFPSVASITSAVLEEGLICGLTSIFSSVLSARAEILQAGTIFSNAVIVRQRSML